MGEVIIAGQSTNTLTTTTTTTTTTNTIMAKRVNVGLDENNKVNGGITPLKPPGGDCHLTIGDNSEEEEEELKMHSKVTQPPGGSSSEIFSDSASDISTSSESSVAPPRKPYRLKSNFVLGHDQPTEIQKPKKKNLKSKVNPITGQVEAGEAGGL